MSITDFVPKSFIFGHGPSQRATVQPKDFYLSQEQDFGSFVREGKALFSVLD
jgi:hypothetical protein